jgi:hypothetical protein
VRTYSQSTEGQQERKKAGEHARRPLVSDAKKASYRLSANFDRLTTTVLPEASGNSTILSNLTGGGGVLRAGDALGGWTWRKDVPFGLGVMRSEGLE